MEGFLIPGMEIILIGFGGTSTLSRGATLAARWLHEHQPISNQIVGWGFYTARGDIDPEDLRFCHRDIGVVEYGKISDPGMGNYLPQVRRNLGVGPRGNSRRVLTP